VGIYFELAKCMVKRWVRGIVVELTWYFVHQLFLGVFVKCGKVKCCDSEVVGQRLFDFRQNDHGNLLELVGYYVLLSHTCCGAV
jgi:hypothetical protein